MVGIRLATVEDLSGIMEVEQEEFGPLGQDAMASSEVMASRIALCNSQDPGWFWVAEHEQRIVGDIILQPTHLTPEECTSWGVATDEGTLQRTFDREGNNLYVVSLAVKTSATPGTADLLVHHSLVLRLSSRKRYYMFCSRMPGFAAANRSSGVSPEEYWQRTRRDGSPTDWMLREYYSMFGERPRQLLLNGFPPDAASGGHGVLFAIEGSVEPLRVIANRIHRAGIVAGWRMRARGQSEQQVEG